MDARRHAQGPALAHMSTCRVRCDMMKDKEWAGLESCLEFIAVTRCVSASYGPVTSLEGVTGWNMEI
jgi:hypothetical protein